MIPATDGGQADRDTRLAPSDAPTAWALEGATRPHLRRPGVLYASHPLYATEEHALEAARRYGGRVLVRRDGGPWERNPRQE